MDEETLHLLKGLFINREFFLFTAVLVSGEFIARHIKAHTPKLDTYLLVRLLLQLALLVSFALWIANPVRDTMLINLFKPEFIRSAQITAVAVFSITISLIEALEMRKYRG